MAAAPRKTRIQRAVQRSQELSGETEAQQELMATKVFDSVVMYTPRGQHGGADDMRHAYPVERVRYPSLAASAREAEELNAKADEEAAKRRKENITSGLRGEQQT